jgi:hypothetical protein
VIATRDGHQGWSIAVFESKGTVGNRNVAVQQLKAGASQAASVTSPLPSRHFALSTALNLDAEVREIASYGVEVSSPYGRGERMRVEELPEGLVDAALVRGLRVLGRFEEAAAVGGLEDEDMRAYVAAQFSEDRTGAQVLFKAGAREMVGRRVILNATQGNLVAEIGIDLRLLRAMLAPTERSLRVTDELMALQLGSRVSPDSPTEPAVLFRDGTALSLQGFERRDQTSSR